jgi:hypothetical protein
MSRINLDPLVTFPDGSSLVISTQYSKEAGFSCALYTAVVSADAGAAFQMVASHLEAATCMLAQEHAYHHALRLYPRAMEHMKKPPYLVWHGPRTLAN